MRMFKPNYSHLPYASLTEIILKSCFEVIQELGSGFLESVYQQALIILLRADGMKVEVEKAFEVYFRGHRVGLYIADMVINDRVIVELKCCKKLLAEHQAQVINYLAAADLPVGLLINFGHRQLEYKRMFHPLHHPAASEASDPAGVADPVSFDSRNKENLNHL